VARQRHYPAGRAPAPSAGTHVVERAVFPAAANDNARTSAARIAAVAAALAIALAAAALALQPFN
jgi:hypothetical protein